MAALLVLCVLLSTHTFADTLKGPPVSPDGSQKIDLDRPPIGHTISLPKPGPLLPSLIRPAAIQLRARPQSVQVGEKLELLAEVLSQHGLPVPDGTTVLFQSGAGELSKMRVKTKKGRAMATLKATVSGPCRVTAASGFIQASAYVYFRQEGKSLGEVLADDSYKSGLGLGEIIGGKISLGRGFAVKANKKGRQGLRYPVSNLAAGKLKVLFSCPEVKSRVEGLLCLVADKKPVVDLRRGKGRKGTRWSLRSLFSDKRDKTNSVTFTAKKQYELTLEWKERAIACHLHQVKGPKLFSLQVKSGKKIPLITSIWLGGHPQIAGPKGMVIEQVKILGR